MKRAAEATLSTSHQYDHRSDADHATVFVGDDDDGRTRRHAVLEVRPAGGRVLETGGSAEFRPILDVIGGGVLDRDEQGLIVGGEARATHFGTDRHTEEQLAGTAQI